MVSRPQLQIEIFHKVAPITISSNKFQAFWDHFLKNWVAFPTAGGSFQQDTIVLTIQGGETTQSIYISFSNIDTASFKYLVYRVTEITGGDYKIYVQKTSDSSWVQVATGDSAERGAINIYDVYDGNIKGLKLEVEGSPADVCTYDYAVITGEYFFPDEADIEGTTTVDKTVINEEVSSAEFSLSNFETAPNTDTFLEIDDNSKVIIWASRVAAELGTTAAKIFGGKVSMLTQELYGKDTSKVKLVCHGHASELFDSPALVYKYHSAVNGRLIIEDALDLCNYLNQYPHSTEWFDEGGQIADVDDQINSTHSVEYDEVKPYSVIKEILDKASNPDGLIGFDIYETPSGTLVGHLRESTDFACPVTPTLRNKIRTVDPHAIKNTQKVYGTIGRTIPESPDDWGESTDGWTADTGSITADSVHKAVGSYSVKMYNAGSDEALMSRSIEDLVYGFGKRASKTLSLYRKFVGDYYEYVADIQVRLYAPDNSNYFYTSLRTTSAPDQHFALVEFKLGTNQEYDADVNPEGVWLKQGSPSWDSLNTLAFFASHGATNKLWIDQPFFGDAPFYAEESDATSATAYGTKEAEPIVDQTLLSDDECSKKAKEVLAKLKDAPIQIQPITVDGDNRYVAGDLITVDGNVLKIIRAKHVFRDADWDTILTVKEVS